MPATLVVLAASKDPEVVGKAVSVDEKEVSFYIYCERWDTHARDAGSACGIKRSRGHMWVLSATLVTAKYGRRFCDGLPR